VSCEQTEGLLQNLCTHHLLDQWSGSVVWKTAWKYSQQFSS